MELVPTVQSLDTLLPTAWQSNKALAACMTELYDKSLWTDVKLHCKDHTGSDRILAHKIVLAARSPVFQAMFFGPCADGKDEVQLDNAEAKVLNLFLRYLYTDNVTLEEETASSVLEMAHYYQVSSLVQFCADYLATILTTENACEILKLATLYQVNILRDACCSFIDKNANEILNSKGFLELPEECLRYILKGDTFYAKETEIFSKVEEWSAIKLKQDNLDNTGRNIKQALGESFYYLRLPTMAFDNFLKCTRRKGYFTVDEYEDLVDFINNPRVSIVKSNSCVERFPKEETLILNEEDGSLLAACDEVSTCFQISVSRDVTLSNIVLSEIENNLAFDKEHYILDKYSNIKFINMRDTETFFSTYNESVLKIKKNRSIKPLTNFLGETLPCDIMVYGSIKITWQKAKSRNIFKEESGEVSDSQEQDEYDVTGENSSDLDDSETEYEDDDDESELDKTNSDVDSSEETEETFRQAFKLLSLTLSQRTIKLREPFIMTKACSPYTITVCIHYSCRSSVKMRARRSVKDTVASLHGHLQVDNVTGSFAGVKSLGFENCSYRN